MGLFPFINRRGHSPPTFPCHSPILILNSPFRICLLTSVSFPCRLLLPTSHQISLSAYIFILLEIKIKAASLSLSLSVSLGCVGIADVSP